MFRSSVFYNKIAFGLMDTLRFHQRWSLCSELYPYVPVTETMTPQFAEIANLEWNFLREEVNHFEIIRPKIITLALDVMSNNKESPLLSLREFKIEGSSILKDYEQMSLLESLVHVLPGVWKYLRVFQKYMFNYSHSCRLQRRLLRQELIQEKEFETFFLNEASLFINFEAMRTITVQTKGETVENQSVDLRQIHLVLNLLRMIEELEGYYNISFIDIGLKGKFNPLNYIVDKQSPAMKVKAKEIELKELIRKEKTQSLISHMINSVISCPGDAASGLISNTVDKVLARIHKLPKDLLGGNYLDLLYYLAQWRDKKTRVIFKIMEETNSGTYKNLKWYQGLTRRRKLEENLKDCPVF